jgi:hypothetical protein
MWSRMPWTGVVSVMSAMMRIVAPQTGQASGKVSYDCRDAGGRAPRVGALSDAGAVAEMRAMGMAHR